VLQEADPVWGQAQAELQEAVKNGRGGDRKSKEIKHHGVVTDPTGVAGCFLVLPSLPVDAVDLSAPGEEFSAPSASAFRSFRTVFSSAPTAPEIRR
jgi:hypothetical protein